jgi:uncharacterized cupin superfamily protein
MVEEAPLTETPSGLVPSASGWFVVNVRDAAWNERPGFATSCRFEALDRPFPELGINIRVLPPGRPNGLYHSETVQEDFLVLSGECLLLIEGQERRLGPWDFVHCPPSTEHIFVAADGGPCAILMVGTRPEGRGVHYPDSDFARGHGAGAEAETDSPQVAYASTLPIRPARPEGWGQLPWA